VITNTFGANKYALGRHGYSDKVGQINEAAAKVARESAGEGGYVLGDIGHSGEFLAPLGTLDPGELKAAYIDQARGLIGGGVDGIIIETMTALEEIVVAIEAVRSVDTDIALFASMAFEASGGQYRTMMGVEVPSAVSEIVSLGVEAVGFNCGKATMEEYLKLSEILVKSAESNDVVLYAEPNAGLPEIVDGELVYKVGAEEFGEELVRIRDVGVSILGGCCGTGPDHIRAIAENVRT
jgi:5-methyltetrahydrofolate--homocysteine methyltransferase